MRAFFCSLAISEQSGMVGQNNVDCLSNVLVDSVLVCDAKTMRSFCKAFVQVTSTALTISARGVYAAGTPYRELCRRVLRDAWLHAPARTF